MNKFIKKNKPVIADLVVYIVMALLGFLTMTFPGIGFENPGLYSTIIFLILALFSFGGYFYTRENKQNYELLLFSLLCIVSGAYLFSFSTATMNYALGTGYLAFSLLNIITKLYYVMELKKDKNELWILRSISLILLLFISFLTIQNFYRGYSAVQTIIIGYFFLTYGIISFIEMILFVKISPSSFKKFVEGNRSDMKKIKSVDSNVEELDEFVKNIEVSKKIKKNKKSLKK